MHPLIARVRLRCSGRLLPWLMAVSVALSGWAPAYAHSHAHDADHRGEHHAAVDSHHAATDTHDGHGDDEGHRPGASHAVEVGDGGHEERDAYGTRDRGGDDRLPSEAHFHATGSVPAPPATPLQLLVVPLPSGESPPPFRVNAAPPAPLSRVDRPPIA